MATQKQRRRRAKEKRHDYDLVFIDEDGVEKPVEREETPRKPPSGSGKGSSTVSKSQSTKKGSAKSSARRGRELQPPSWPKVLKRGGLFAPVFFAAVYLLGGSKGTFQSALVQTVLLIAVFIPFSYFMDRLFWRQQQKRLSRGA
jgi:hypothetical protein